MPLPPTVRLTAAVPPSAVIEDPLVATYGAVAPFSLQPCTSTQLPSNASREQIAAVTIATCAAYAANASGSPLPPVTAEVSASYCDSPTCVGCTPDTLEAGLCLPGVYVFAYTAPTGLYAWPNGTAATPPVLLLAAAVAEVGGWSVQIGFPAADAAAGAALAVALAADTALLTAVGENVQAQASASLSTVAAGNGTGSLLDVTASPARVLPAAPAASGSSFIVALEVQVVFRYVPGLRSYRSAWPQGATNMSTSAPAPASRRRRLMRYADRSGQAGVPRWRIPRVPARTQQGNGAMPRAPAVWAIRQPDLVKMMEALSLEYSGGGKSGRALLASVGRSLQQTSLIGLQSLLAGAPCPVCITMHVAA